MLGWRGRTAEEGPPERQLPMRSTCLCALGSPNTATPSTASKSGSPRTPAPALTTRGPDPVTSSRCRGSCTRIPAAPNTLARQSAAVQSRSTPHTIWCGRAIHSPEPLSNTSVGPTHCTGARECCPVTSHQGRDSVAGGNCMLPRH